MARIQTIREMIGQDSVGTLSNRAEGLVDFEILTCASGYMSVQLKLHRKQSSYDQVRVRAYVPW